MAKPPGRCIFCDGFGLSKEHVLPDWLRSIFPRLATDTHTFNAASWLNLPTVGMVPLPSKKSGQGHSLSKKVRVVCEQCNTGWMHAMEDAVKPLLEDLVWGRPRTINVNEQRELAAWIAKTTMTAEFLMPSQVAIKKTERAAFKENLEPNKNWKIWIGLYQGLKWRAGGIFHHGLGLYPPPHLIKVGVKNTQCTAIGLGHLFVYAFSTEEDGVPFALSEQLAVNIPQIWPINSDTINWVPGAYIGDAEFAAIAGALGKRLGTPMPGL